MKYKLLVFDFDGTVRPTGEERITRPVADALNAVQAAGVKLAVATGRCRGALPPKLLRGVKPDYFICANGAQVETRLGERLYADRMTTGHSASSVKCTLWWTGAKTMNIRWHLPLMMAIMYM